MSSVYSSLDNCSSKQQDNMQGIKQFSFSDRSNTAFWTYKRDPTTNAPTIIPANQNSSVLINKDLTVVGSINNPSDIKKKENINIITNDISDSIIKLKPIEFQYLNDDSTHYGLIAQEVENIFPTLVKYNDSIDCKTVNYLELLPLIINKIKKMQDEIDSLQEKIKMNDTNKINEPNKNHI